MITKWDIEFSMGIVSLGGGGGGDDTLGLLGEQREV